MGLWARVMFGWVSRRATRDGLAAPPPTGEAADPTEEGRQRRRTGVEGEAFAYWYLRRQGYRMVGRNVRFPRHHGELDLIGWDGPVLAFVEVKTRTTATGGPPEEGVDPAQQRTLQTMARQYCARRGLDRTPCRFDIVALEVRPGAAPAVRLHKGAFGGN